MDVMESIRKRRSTRVYKTTPVDDKTLETILEAGRLAPSWANSQTWRFIVVKDSSVKAQLADNALRLGNRGTNAVKIAPVVIAACAELNKAGFRDGVPSTDKDGYWFMFDAGLALENMALVARSFGLGTLFVGGMNAKKAENILGVPQGYAFVILMVLGYPDEQQEAKLRKAVTEVVYRDRFGNTSTG